MTTTATDLLPGQRQPGDVLEAAVAAFGDGWCSMAGHLDGSGSEVSDGVASVRLGLPVAAMNGVWGLAPEVTAETVLAAVDGFSGGDLPWNVQLRPGYPDELDGALAERGLVVTADIPFMVLADPSRLAAAAAVAPARRLVTFEDLDRTIDLLERGFGMPTELTRRTFPIPVVFLRGSTSWLVSGGGTDVATATGLVRGDTCTVLNVATPPEDRGRGYGAAATAHAVLEAMSGGARYACLQASPMGVAVYERLGFVTVERWRQWMPAQYAG